MSNMGLKSILVLKTVYSFQFNTFQYFVDIFYPIRYWFDLNCIKKKLKDRKILPIYLFSNSDVLGLKIVLKVDLLHSLGLWSVDRSPPDSNGQKFDRWSVDRAVDQQSILARFWAITASFWSHINKRSFGMFYARFWRVFKSYFSSLLEVFQQVFGLNFHTKRVFIKSDSLEFFKSFSLSFSLSHLSCFSSHKLELFIATSIL